MTLRKRLLAALTAATLAATPVWQAATPWLPPTAAGLVVTGAATDAWARAGGSRSSGGYSRPSTRTPSFSAPSYSAPRTPSTSGGYARPSAPSATPSFRAPPSAGDQAISRQRAADSLRQQQATEQRRQEAQRPAPQPTPAPSSSSGSTRSWWSGGSSSSRTPSSAPPPPAGGWFGQQGWAPPAYAAAAPRSFGIWDGLFLWFMLDNLTRPGTTDWFRNHRTDPGVQQWRQQADALSQDNADLRRKLAELDQRAPPGAAPDTGWVEVPPGIPPEVATADTGKQRTPSTEGGGMGLFGITFSLLLIGGAGWLAWRATRTHVRDSKQRNPDVNRLVTEAAIKRSFRVGMVLTADLSPFILAAGATRVTPPSASTEGRMSVAAVGRQDMGSFVRLHLDDRKGMFQLHLDAAGQPDECRYFSLFDEVTPADAGEWEVWLNPQDGLIGWPEFQAKDGKLYQRVWSPGTSKVAPVPITEEITTAEGSESVQQQAMLYGAPTGLAAPAPQTEYILVTAVQRQGQAWVELRAGIDINPATLELS